MKTFYSFFFVFAYSFILFPQVPYNLTPSWISADVSSVSTGGMFADIDKDGWMDFVVANGNDMARQKVAVYYNNGSGGFPSVPGWQSSDIDYHGHLDVADVNADGYPDVAVSVYIGASGFGSPGKVKLYINNSGTLSANPVWISGDAVYTFSCAFGDADGDGDPDLAVAGGESYDNHPEQPRIYYNNGGTLESLPSWKGTASQYSYDVNWADFDNDGDLDVVFAGESTPNRIFQNNNGVISTTPVWQSADASQYANSLYTADVNRDGFIDLAISDNNQLGGTGKFKIYLNNNGLLNTAPYWTSSFSGYGSGIMLSDIDNDLDADLLTGGWWQPCRIYLNNSGTFNVNPQYTSTSTSVVEAITCADVDRDMIQNVQEFFVSSGTIKLFYVSRVPLQAITRVIAGNDTLNLNEYCYDLETGWISLAVQPPAGMVVSVEALVSWDLDMGITNWDNNKGNYLYLNNTAHPAFQLSVDVNSVWNMLSIPGLHPLNQDVNTWWAYRDPNTQVFKGWNNTYQPVNAAAPGTGYWVKHPVPRTYNTGDEWPSEGIKTFPRLPISCSAGWNMIGLYEENVNAFSLTTTPPGLLTGAIFAYDGGYTPTGVLSPGKAYWAKLTGAGVINIPLGTTEKSSSGESSNSGAAKIIITDSRDNTYALLAFGNETDLSLYDLPPLPPGGMFDIRFASQKYGEILGRKPEEIQLQGVHFPIKIKSMGIDIILSDEAGNKIAFIKNGNEYVLREPSLKLYASTETVPLMYSLEQNYPNPFNPETSIRFSIAEDAVNVKLIIYNSLGEKVDKLIDSEYSAGTYEVKWNADGFAGGIYFFQLITDKFTAVKKMILVK